MPLRGDRLRWPPRPGKKFSGGASVKRTHDASSTDALSADEISAGPAQSLRQPNERDASADAHSGAPRGIIKQAHDDVAQGQQDTDCRNQSGQVIDRACKAPGKAGSDKSSPGTRQS